MKELPQLDGDYSYDAINHLSTLYTHREPTPVWRLPSAQRAITRNNKRSNYQANRHKKLQSTNNNGSNTVALSHRHFSCWSSCFGASESDAQPEQAIGTLSDQQIVWKTKHVTISRRSMDCSQNHCQPRRCL